MIESDVVLSVLVPAAATQAASEVAQAIGNVGKSIFSKPKGFSPKSDRYKVLKKSTVISLDAY
ncbi:hypothetical protein [Nostoc sp.]|uniref:hypothetical protein n=1 Tax=Nostoc sp. TaxID=1180 RepID=UPI002FF7F296